MNGQMNRFLTLEQMKRMSIDEIVYSYKQGYALPLSSCKTCGKDSLRGNKLNGRTMRLGPASCPTSIVQGTTKPITIAGTGGTPPYRYQFFINNILYKDVLGQTGPYTWNKEFGENPGTYTLKVRLTDSCSSGAKVVEDSCTITITAPPPPPLVCGTQSVILTIPG